MLNKTLARLGFTEKESKIYLTLLEQGTLRARDLSRKTSINRVTVYDILEGLAKKGLISKIKKSGATFFTALEPARLLNDLDRKTEALEEERQKLQDILPQFISLQYTGTSKPKVQFFEGEKGMREAYEDTLTTKKQIIAYANFETMQEGLPGFFPKYFHRRAGKKIFIRAVFPQNKLSLERAQHNQEEFRDTRFFPENVTFSPEVNVYDNKMLVASWKEKMAVIIESKELADLQKVIFESLWQTLPSLDRLSR